MLYAREKEFVVRVYYNTPADINKLFAYDIHEYNNRKDRYFLATVNEQLYQQLINEGWKVSIDTDAGKMSAVSATTFLGAYRTVKELYEDMAATTAAYPDITEIVDYGDAYCKQNGGSVTPGGDTQEVYDLLAVKVTNKKNTEPKPVFFLMAAIHAREISTPEIAMRFLDWMTENYGVNPDATWLVNSQETWIVPVANPEGHWIVELGTMPPYNGSPFSQRKSANENDGCSSWTPVSGSQYGVDLNRNHSFLWNTGGSASSPCEMTYHGVSAASEPEVNQLQNLITSLIPDQRGPSITSAAPESTTGILISLHSYSELVLWPWANSSSKAPNSNGLEAIGNKFASYNNYTPQQSYQLYPTSGDSTDWTYGELGIPAFTFELGNYFDGFMPLYSRIDSKQWPENKPALIYAAKIARIPYSLVKGPDTKEIEFISGPSNIVTLSALIDDRENGNEIIEKAEYYINNPYWISNAIAYPMTISTTFFDGRAATVNAEIDINLLSNNTEIVYIRGKDVGENWGPVSAVFISDIPEPLFFQIFGMLFLWFIPQIRRELD